MLAARRRLNLVRFPEHRRMTLCPSGEQNRCSATGVLDRQSTAVEAIHDRGIDLPGSTQTALR